MRRSTFRSTCPGATNVLNALAAIGVATELKVPAGAIQRALAGFRGVGRRFQQYGEVKINGAAGSFSSWMTTATIRRKSPRRWTPRGWRFRGGGWCSRSSRIATPARATCSRTSSKCWRAPTCCCWQRVYAAGEAPIAAADSRALASAVQGAGKSEPLFVEDVSGMGRRDPPHRARGRCGAHHGRRIDRQRCGAAELTMADTLQFRGLRGELRENEPMSRHLSWRAGGPRRGASSRPPI